MSRSERLIDYITDDESPLKGIVYWTIAIGLIALSGIVFIRLLRGEY